jgi:putative ABC transport system permease protein
MNLALRDLRRHLARFVGTAAGLGLLLTVVIAMQGIYAGMVDDATILTRAMRADLWLVQRDTRGPFAEGSRLDPSIEARAAAVPGVRRARPYTYQLIQRERDGAVMRIALVGLGWPDDRGETLPLVRGRPLQQPHGEIIVDSSLGLNLGATLRLAEEPYRVVGLTRNALTSGGDSVAFLSVADAHLLAARAAPRGPPARTAPPRRAPAPHRARPRPARARRPRPRPALATAGPVRPAPRRHPRRRRPAPPRRGTRGPCAPGAT